MIVYNLPIRYDEPEQTFSNNKGTITMVQEAARLALLGDGNFYIMEEFNFKETLGTPESTWRKRIT